MAWREGDTTHIGARLARLAGDRENIRDRSAKCALQLLRLKLMGEDLDQLKWATAP